MNIGLDQRERELVATSLKSFLADTFVLYLKVLGYHWNVTGPSFISLHQLFETIYNDLNDASDLIAERIRALGFYAPASLNEFSYLTVVAEDRGTNSEMMVQQLAADCALMARRATEVCKVADSCSDYVTLDLITKRLHAHTHFAWMLNSQREDYDAE